MNATNLFRPLSVIADDIICNWRSPYFGAVPYIEAMLNLDRITDNYGADPGQQIVAYFLSNAKSWRGDVARRVKAELNEMLKQARPERAARNCRWSGNSARAF